MNYQEAKRQIKETGYKGIVLGLDRMINLMSYLGNPEKDIKVIHVTGTNGKGSVISFLSSVLTKEGYVTGAYTSPFVESVREQYVVDKEWIEENEYANCAAYVIEAVKRMRSDGKELPTVFEIETALAFVYFREKKCDYVLLETGLGGQDDATNVVCNTILAVFTSISLDHIGMIGNNLVEIAENKAGIIKNNMQTVIHECEEKALKVLTDRAKEHNSYADIVRNKDLYNLSSAADGTVFSYKEFTNVHICLEGEYQIDNALTALECCRQLRTLGVTISDDSIYAGFSSAKWPYRMDKISTAPLIYLDGAHNEAASLKLRDTLKKKYTDKDIILVLGVFKDKDYEKIASNIAPLAKYVYVVELPNLDRTLNGEVLLSCVQSYVLEDTPAVYCESLRKAAVKALDCCSKASNGMILVCGSLSYLCDMKKELLHIVQEAST